MELPVNFLEDTITDIDDAAAAGSVGTMRNIVAHLSDLRDRESESSDTWEVLDSLVGAAHHRVSAIRDRLEGRIQDAVRSEGSSEAMISRAEHAWQRMHSVSESRTVGMRRLNEIRALLREQLDADDVDRDNVALNAGRTLWEDALYLAAGYAYEDNRDALREVGLGDLKLTDVAFEFVPSDEVMTAAGMPFIEAFEKASGKPLEQIVSEDLMFGDEIPSPDDEEYMGYYMAMEALGHGVAWSDSRNGELPDGVYMDNPFFEDAEFAVAKTASDEHGVVLRTKDGTSILADYD